MQKLRELGVNVYVGVVADPAAELAHLSLFANELLANGIKVTSYSLILEEVILRLVLLRWLDALELLDTFAQLL